jgi:ferric-dicitrate binding protein FerR (iron transport regulator)
MARTDTTTVIARLLDDDYIHEQMGTAGAGMRDAYRRVRHLPPQKAVQDKTVYEHLRQTATGLSEATRRALGKPKPKPARRRRGLLALVLLTTGAVVMWAAKSHRPALEGSEQPDAGSAPAVGTDR